jgi:Zn-dependent protease
MSWSFRIARVSGIDIRVHATFFLIVLIGATQYARFGLPGLLFGTTLILLLFLCVTLHELGHSVVAQKFGVQVRQIVLLPIGGVAMMQRIPRNPWEELWIALAGPVVNVVIAAALWLGIVARERFTGVDFGQLLALGRDGPSGALMLSWLLSANMALVVFNMVPAFPLDGGRVLRAILAMRMTHARATAIAAVVGQVLAVALGTLGLVSGNFLLVIVAAFIFFGAGAENLEGRARTVLSGHRVGDAYNRRAVTLRGDDRLGTVVDHILTSYQPDFAVTDGPQLIGVVTRHDVIRALSEGARDISVRQIMTPAAVRVSVTQTLDEVRQSMSENSARLAAVYDGPHYLGLVSSEDIDEAYAVLRFINGDGATARGGASGERRDGGVVI